MKINGNEIPKGVLAKAITCETPEELVKLAKEYGVELTTEEAGAYLDELDDIDITAEQLRMAAGGTTGSNESKRPRATCPNFGW